ncbi:MAG: hypothetical protein ACK4Z4_03685 [Ferrovibrio sp.]
MRDVATVLQDGTPLRILYEELGDQCSLLRIVVPAPRFVAALMRGGLVRRRRVAGYNADRSPVWDGDGVLLGPMSEMDAVAFIAWKDVPAHVNRREIISVGQLPADRTYRNAWRMAS